MISTLVAKVMTDLWSWGGFFWAKMVWLNKLSPPHVRWGRNIQHNLININFYRIKRVQSNKFRISTCSIGRNLRCNRTNTCDGLNKHLCLFDPKWVCPNKNQISMCQLTFGVWWGRDIAWHHLMQIRSIKSCNSTCHLTCDVRWDSTSFDCI